MSTGLTEVPFLDVGASYREIEGEIDEAVRRVLASGRYVLGSEVEAFEHDYAAFVGAPECISVANGLDALTLALVALDVGPGDEVIVPANTYIATWLAVTRSGASIVPVEPDEATYNVTADAVEAAITNRTKVIMPVHLYGQPVDLAPIRALAGKHGLRIVEDAAQAHGARYRGARIGSDADVVAWSFYPGKNLGAVGDGGAVTTGDAALADRLRSLRNYGSTLKYVNEEVGFNSRLDPIQAAVLGVKLRYLDEWNRRRGEIADRYQTELEAAPVRLPHVLADVLPAWHLFVVRTAYRDNLAEHLSRCGIGTMVHYPIPPHLQQAYAHLGFEEGSFPITEAVHREVLSLPIGPHLSAQQHAQVIDAVGEWAPAHH